MKTSIVNFAMERPVTMGMVFLLGMVLGIISFFKIPLQLLPSGFTRSQITIRISYPNLAPQEIVDKILEPLEGAMFTIKGIYQIKSIASPNQIRLQLTFREGVDLSMVYGDIQDRIERTRSLLPSDLKTKNIRIFKHSTDDIPVAALAIAYPKDLMGLDRLIDVQIRDKINRIPGVANVEVFGISDYAIFVDLNYQKLKSSGISVYQMIQELRTASVALPCGYAYDGKKKLFIRVLSQVNSLKEIRNLAITQHMALKKMASVKMAMPAPPFMATLEGKPSILVLVYKESNANTVEVCRKIENFTKKAKIPNLKVHLVFSQGTFIQNSLENLESTALWGGFFAILILLIFLRRLSLTLLIGLAVPSSLVFTLVAMYFIGQSLNIISLMGIMLAIGMLVDNSVVVVESIARGWEKGLSPREAALKGGNMVALAITTATLTTAVVFLPFFLIESSLRFWLVELGLPICISLIASLLVALLFIPLGTILLLGQNKSIPTQKEGSLTRGYLFLLKKALDYPFETTLLVLLVSASFWIPYQRLPRTDRVEGHASSVRIRLRFPGSKSLSETAKKMHAFESILMKKKKILDVEWVRTFFSTNRGSVSLHFPSHRPPRHSPQEFFRLLKKELPQVPGVVAKIQGESDQNSLPQVKVRIVGKDPVKLFYLAKQVGEKLKKLKDVVDVDLDSQEDSNEIHGYLRKELLEKFQITPERVGQTIRWSLNGAPLPSAVMGNRELDVQMGLREEDRKNLGLLKRIEVTSNRGKKIPVGALVHFIQTKAMDRQVRINKKTQITLTLTLGDKNLYGFQRKLREKLAQIHLPEGYEFQRGNRFRAFREMMETGIFALSLDIVLVFLLMGVLFESFFLPLCVMISIPFAFLGVFWILYLTQTPLEIMSMIGMVILVGLVVNNAIVLIDRMKQLENQYSQRKEAILQAGRERLRPILITALTTLAGLLPMALGSSNIIGRPYYPLGRTVIGGLFTSTLLTLFVVPLFYYLLVRFQDFLKNVLGVRSTSSAKDV